MTQFRKPKVTGGARVRKPKGQLARQLRRQQTPMEAWVWEMLRDRRTLNLKFRRQQVIIGYVVDFYCPALNLAIELDGGIHDTPESAAHDAIRERALANLGIRVLRLRNEDATEAALLNALRSLRPLSIHGEGGVRSDRYPTESNSSLLTLSRVRHPPLPPNEKTAGPLLRTGSSCISG